MKNLEHYSDYRQYLKDYYEDAKQKHSFFSHRYFCRKAGIKSASLYQEVMLGKRKLTDMTIPCFIKGLELNEKEGHFFHALVHFNQSKSAIEKTRYLEEIRNLLPRITEKKVPMSLYAYYSKWYHIALRELACAFNWKENYTLLASKVCPPISTKEAKESIRLLLDLGMLLRDKDGTYRQSSPLITTGSEVVSVAVRNVNHQLAQLGVEAINQFSPTVRDISSFTVGLSEDSYQQIKQEIIGFRERIKRIVTGQKIVKKVYNVNIQLFPLSEEIES